MRGGGARSQAAVGDLGIGDPYLLLARRFRGRGGGGWGRRKVPKDKVVGCYVQRAVEALAAGEGLDILDL